MRVARERGRRAVQDDGAGGRGDVRRRRRQDGGQVPLGNASRLDVAFPALDGLGLQSRGARHRPSHRPRHRRPAQQPRSPPDLEVLGRVEEAAEEQGEEEVNETQAV